MFTFRLMLESDLEQVMAWRTSKKVSQFMQTDIEPNLEHQKAWFNRVASSDQFVYWIIEYNATPIGVINLADLDEGSKQCSWGFYIGDVNSANLGGFVPPYLYNFLFHQTNITSLVADVMDHNTMVKKLHILHGYCEKGVLDTVIEKGMETFRLRRFELSKSTWLQKKRFSHFVSHFEGFPGSLLD